MITDQAVRVLLTEAHAQDIVRIEPVPPNVKRVDLDQTLSEIAQARADIRALVMQAERDLHKARTRPQLSDDQIWWIRQRLMLDWR